MGRCVLSECAGGGSRHAIGVLTPRAAGANSATKLLRGALALDCPLPHTHTLTHALSQVAAEAVDPLEALRVEIRGATLGSEVELVGLPVPLLALLGCFGCPSTHKVMGNPEWKLLPASTAIHP